jgi:hypothetical protein
MSQQNFNIAPQCNLPNFFQCRGRIDLLQREVSDLNSKLAAASSLSGIERSAEEWAPYFQAAQRDHAQKIQVTALQVFWILTQEI